MSYCLCGNVDHPSGWCYLGETVNDQRHSVNLTTVEPSKQASLKCTLYVTVGKSYLYCNSRIIGAEASSCRTLLPCPSRTVTVVCDEKKDCLAWCDANGTAGLKLEEEETGVEQGVPAPTEVTHHLGRDVIGVIATGGVLCVLVLVCCIVDKVRNSKWWILHFPKKRKQSMTMSVEFTPVSRMPQPAGPNDLTPSLVTHMGESENASQRKPSKKKVQFRSVSLPTMLDSYDNNVIIDQPIKQHVYRTGSCGNSPPLRAGDHTTFLEREAKDQSGSNVPGQAKLDTTKL